ncbi:MAG: hypothetical protein ACOH5I_05290 [Oligoflexus sp.]
MSEQWMSIVEYARKFAISDMTVRRRIRNGKLHAVLRDGKYFIPMHDQHDQQSTDYADSDTKNFVSNKPPVPIVPRSYSASEDTSFSNRSAAYELNDRHSSQKVAVDSIRSTISRPAPSPYDAQALMRTFETTLARFSSMEKSLKESYEAKIQALEDRLKSKEIEITRLHQQVEDLQTLINMIDQPSKP